MNKKILYGVEARNRIVQGAEKLEKIVSSTLGPAGHNVIIYEGGVRPLISKDGKTVSNHVDIDDPLEKIGVQMAKDVVDKVDHIAGDGTTTTTIYYTTLLKIMNNLVNLGVDPNELRKGLELATKDAVELLTSLVYKTTDVAAIANVSANGNTELSKLLVEAYNSIGEYGSVVLTDSWRKSGESYVEVSNGIKWAGGIPSSLFFTDNINQVSKIENPYIMVFAVGVDDFEPLKPYIELTHQQERNLVLIAPYFEPKLWAKFVENGVCCINSPGTSYSRVDLHDALMDLAIVLGTKVIPSVSSAIKVVPDLSDLGTAAWVVTSLEETNITQSDELSEEHAKAYEDYIEQLKAKIDEDNDLQPTVIEALKDRLASLSGGIATIHIGALTPTEKEEKIALLVDAQNSVEKALKFGTLPGGGTALLKVAQILAERKHDFSSDELRKGYEAVLEAMREPAKRLVSSVKPNDYQYIVQQVAHEKDFWTGYNVRTEQIENLKDSKIFDSSVIEVKAMQYSASEIGSFIISDGVVINDIDNVRFDKNDRVAAEVNKW